MKQVIIVLTWRKGKKTKIVMHSYTESEGLEDQGQPWLHSEFKATLSYRTGHEISCKNKNKKPNKGAKRMPGRG